jgi:hypothetical protein
MKGRDVRRWRHGDRAEIGGRRRRRGWLTILDLPRDDPEKAEPCLDLRLARRALQNVVVEALHEDGRARGELYGARVLLI